MHTEAEEIKSQYASNRKQITRDFRKIECLERGIRHSEKISERKRMQDDIVALHRGIEDMNKQNNQAIKRVNGWWRD